MMYTGSRKTQLLGLANRQRRKLLALFQRPPVRITSDLEQGQIVVGRRPDYLCSQSLLGVRCTKQAPRFHGVEKNARPEFSAPAEHVIAGDDEAIRARSPHRIPVSVVLPSDEITCPTAVTTRSKSALWSWPVWPRTGPAREKRNCHQAQRHQWHPPILVVNQGDAEDHWVAQALGSSGN